MAVNPVSFTGDALWQEKINRRHTYTKKEMPAAASSIRYERKEEGSFFGKTFKLLTYAAVIAGLLAVNHKKGWVKAEPEADGLVNKLKAQIDNAGNWVCKKWDGAVDYVKNFFPAGAEEKVNETAAQTAVNTNRTAEAVNQAAEETIDAGGKTLEEARQELTGVLGKVLSKKEEAEAAAQAGGQTEKALVPIGLYN